MCQFYSGIITKAGNVLDIEGEDSHEKIIREYNLNDTKPPELVLTKEKAEDEVDEMKL